MASRLSVYNGALRLLGCGPLQGLGDRREERVKLDEVWNDEFIKVVLAEGQWNFAMRSVSLSYSPSLEPDFGLQYAFDRPTDCVRVSYFCSDGSFSSPIENYQPELSYWFSDVDTIYVRYISSDASYGGDLGKWPAFFAQFVEAHLACEVRQGITQSQVLLNELEIRRKQRLDKALSVDAMEAPTRRLPSGSWVRSRTRGNSEFFYR